MQDKKSSSAGSLQTLLKRQKKFACWTKGVVLKLNEMNLVGPSYITRAHLVAYFCSFINISAKVSTIKGSILETKVLDFYLENII